MRYQQLMFIGLILSSVVISCQKWGAPLAEAELQDGDGQVVGHVLFFDHPDGVRITVQVEGLPAGDHGIHLHAIGRCDPSDFTSSGGHFNPKGKEHGFDNPKGLHAGDLPNLIVAENGMGRLDYINPRVTLKKGVPNSILDDDGTAVVIHAGPDDMKTDPSGESGARIACGVVRATAKARTSADKRE